MTAFKAGWNFGETTEAFAVAYEVKPAKLRPGTYRNISGNLALSYGLVAASQLSGLPLFLGAYPITPASDILHELSKHKAFGVRTFQAEDEIAGVGAALGAAFGGALGVTTSSGPGIALKAETIGLAVSLELPLLVIDIQRSGPSTGMPTKTEQADLLQVLYGRNGEAPVPVVAPCTPSDCFHAAVEAARIALKYRTPVVLLSDGYLANGSEPWLLPDVASLPDISVEFATEPNHEGDFWPYLRDEATLARPWAVPGTPGLEHRIGGLEKADGTGNISYDPDNHDRMVNLPGGQGGRDRRRHRAPGGRPPGRVAAAGAGLGLDLRADRGGGAAGPGPGARVSVAHLRHLNPFPANLGEVLAGYDQVLIPEMNLGQLRLLVALPVPGRRRRLQQGPGAAVQGRGAGRRHHRAAGRRSGQVTAGNGHGNGAPVKLTAKDFKSDQEVRWCPGCGDYAILSAVQGFMPSLGIPRERIVFVSGIGCSSRFPYYMNTYGMHSIHGRAPAIATGLSVTRPDLSVWVITGDGDALSIGGNHLIHALRRNVNLKILLFNNQIYGLTKGQYSPTSELGKITKSTPMGSLDHPFNPVSVALGAEATFVARSIDSDRAHLTEVLRKAAAHRGTAFVEIYQNCNIFNDGAFDLLKEPDTRADNQIRLEHGKPIRFGADGERGVRLTDDCRVELVEVADVGEDALLVHDEHRAEPSLAFMLCRLSHGADGPTPIGVFRDVERPVYDELMSEQLEAASTRQGRGDLAKLLHGGDTWQLG